MTKEIIEGNKLIAEFMQLPCPPIYDETPFGHGCGYGYVDESELLYHSSWDWLMPVVEKIESDASQETGHCEIQITENHCRIYRFSHIKEFIKAFNSSSKRMAVWDAIVQYVEWYNKQNSNS